MIQHRRTDPLADLDQVIVSLAESGNPSAGRVATALATWRDNDVSFADALGLPWRWRQADVIARRDAIIRDIARCHFRQNSARSRASALARALREYEACSFKRHKQTGRPDGLHGHFFDILQLGQAPGIASLRNILSKMPG